MDQLPAIHRAIMRSRGFSGSTVPGLVLDGRRVHGSRAIMRALDELQPDPPLYPSNGGERQAVEDALAWGEDIYQSTLRVLLPYSLLRRPRAVASVLEDSLIPVPTHLLARSAAPAVFVNRLLNGSSERGVRRRLAELPPLLNHVDALIREGVLNADRPGAADYMIAPTTRSLFWWDDLRPSLEGRPLAEHALRVAPRYPGAIPPVFPPEALTALRA